MKYLLIALLVIAIYAISWAATLGIIWLICLCFGWTFSWQIGTGVWLMLLLLKSAFNVGKKE